jgi:hypothetical protein
MLQSNNRESLRLLECGAVKQWEVTGLLPAHSSAANRAFQKQKTGWDTTNGKNLHRARLRKQLQTALIISVTFIWSHPWVGLNGLWFMIAFIFPSLPVANIFGKNVFRALFFLKMPLETGAPPPNVLMLPPPQRKATWLWRKREIDSLSQYKTEWLNDQTT